ncbi:MAG TPA: hypothetical protein VHS58_20755 [Acetobacteraceae bacterium]|jgi:hypothetical protein|nr:hypothetical protein [Acetobacteraceae bacterium]
MAFQPNDFRPRQQFGAPDLDMTPDGRFRRPASLPLGTRIGVIAVVVAVLAGAIAVAALLLWAAVLLIPVAIVAAVIAYVAFRVQLWRARTGGRITVWTPRR